MFRVLCDWATPQKLVDLLNERHGPFELDVAANGFNRVCPRFFGVNPNGLDQPWAPYNCFMNPPYEDIEFWIVKALQESRQGAKVTCILPAWTDQNWFHQIAMKAQIIYFVQGRIKFGESKRPAPFATIVCVFDSEIKNQSIGTIDIREPKSRQNKRTKALQELLNI